MSEVLGVTLPAIGHLMPQLPILAELARRGHEAGCLSLPRHQALIESFGVRFEALPVSEAEARTWDDVADDPRGLRLLSLYTRLLDRTPGLLNDLLAVRSAPDLVLADAACPWSHRAARRWRRPCVTLVPTFAWTVPSLLSSPRALVGLASEVGDLPALMHAQARLARVEGEPPTPPWKLLEPRGERVLVLTSRELQPAAWSVPRHWGFIGPTSPVDVVPADSRDQVYVSLGTVLNDPVWWRGVVRALEPSTTGPGFHALLVVGSHLSVASLSPQMPGVEVTSWADQTRELARSRVFVTHGGMNGVGEALRLGVPLVISPQATDSRWVAARIERLGAGLNVGPQPNPETLRHAINRLWHEPDFAERAAQLGQGLRSAGGTIRAADEIEALLGGR